MALLLLFPSCIYLEQMSEEQDSSVPSAAAQRILELKKRVLKKSSPAPLPIPVPRERQPSPVPEQRQQEAPLRLVHSVVVSPVETVSKAVPAEEAKIKKRPLTLKSLMSTRNSKVSVGSNPSPVKLVDGEPGKLDSSRDESMKKTSPVNSAPAAKPIVPEGSKPFVSRLKEAPAHRAATSLIRSKIVSFNKPTESPTSVAAVIQKFEANPPLALVKPVAE